MPSTLEDRIFLSEIAQGKKEAETVISGGKIVNVYSKEIMPGNIAIAGERVAYVGNEEIPVGPKTEVISAEGYFLSPGYIEPHAHPWVIYNPISLSKVMLARGTTSLIMDSLVFYQLIGPKFFRQMVKTLKSFFPYPHFYWAIRAVSQSLLPDEDQLFSLDNIKPLLKIMEVVSIAEITRWPQLLKAEPLLMQKLEFALKEGKRIDGHTAGCNFRAINALAALGVSSCHEPINTKEVLARLRLGMWVMLRNSSIRPDLRAILPDLIEKNISLDRVMMTNDGAEPTFLSRKGFTEGLVKMAIEMGLDPITAIKMVTLNPAVFYGLDNDLGGIAPGKFADILFLKDLQDPTPESVMVKGRMVIRNSRRCYDLPKNFDWNKIGFGPKFKKPQWLEQEDILRPPQGRVPVIAMVSSGITRLDFTQWDGITLPEKLKFCCLLGRQGEYLITCFLQDFVDDIQGLATSFTNSMGILVIGNSPGAMKHAVERLYEIGGGITVCDDFSIKYELPLAIGGLMSSLEFDEVVDCLNILNDLMLRKGFPHNDLLLSLIFLSCDFLPSVRITPLGILNVKNREIIFPPKI